MSNDILDRFAEGKKTKGEGKNKDKKIGWMDIRKRGAQLSETVDELIPAIKELNRNIRELNENIKKIK